MKYCQVKQNNTSLLEENTDKMIQKKFQPKNQTFNGFKTPKGNYIWAGAMTLAWKELCSNILLQPNVKIQSNDQIVLKIVQNYNRSKLSVQDIDKNSIYVKSGYGQQTVNLINKQTKKKFPQKSFTDLNIKLKSTDLIAYAYLFKNIEFKTPFKRSEGNLFEFQGKKVPSFYAQNQQQKQQIFYSYYKNEDQFMINMYGKKDGDAIYFIKNKQIHDVQHAIKAVQLYQNKQKNHLKNYDHFQMPIVQFDMKRQIKELMGKQLKNKNLNGYSFGYVYEAVKLQINQKGAKVQNQAVMTMLTSGFVKNQPEPKYFVLDKYFWVVMKQYGKHPYLCFMIKNPTENYQN